MSVIAKVDIRRLIPFGTGQLVELGCIAANDMMAAYAGSEEDRLFTKYSPWGELIINQPSGYSIGGEPRPLSPAPVFYVMCGRDDEVHDRAFPGAWAFTSARCTSLTDFGDGQAKRVEFYDWNGSDDRSRGVDLLNWKMSVDNPRATDQFLPGKDDYWIAIHPADSFDRDGAILAFHSRPAD